jgi:predicted outer membrane repeat protein
VYAPGAAVYNNADLTLESCIFSGNRNNNKATPYVCHGGAIYSDKKTTLIVKGCTFYNNIAGGGGGAIAVDADITLLEFAGNLFYENFQNYGTAVFGSGKNIASGGYNAVDEQGTNGWNPVTSGWSPITAPDKIITSVSISPLDFTLSGSEDLLNDLLFRPGLDYPMYDFYGKEIPNDIAAPGAVQL